MQYIVFHHDEYQPIDVDLTTVTLAHNPLLPNSLNAFYCNKCGNYVGQHTGYIFRSSAADPGTDLSANHPTYITQCKKCKHKYLIANIL